MTWREVLEVVQRYWLQLALGGLGGAATAWLAWLKKQLRWRRTINAAMLAILHERLFSQCIRLLEAEVATRGELESLQLLYGSYKDLGGNGTIEQLMGRVKQKVRIVRAVPEREEENGGERG